MAAIASVMATPCAASAPMRFAIQAGPLRESVVQFGIQADVTIGLADPAMGDVRVRAVKGRMRAAEALRRMLDGTPASFVALDATTFRIVRRHLPAAARERRRPSPPAPPAAAGDIVVTASKRNIAVADYPGSVVVADLSTWRPYQLAGGSGALIEQLPILSSTHLGPGRNKLFIRGIADSSFSGPTQATVGQYLGDIRLNYSAPDPNLALYDIASVEILEGPQGTLYGAGSLGGIFRLVPNMPSLAGVSGSIQGGGALTQGGAAGGDVAAVVDLPIVTGRLGARLVGYISSDGGYIDDPARGRRNVNRTTTRGGRATIRLHPSADWTIDLTGVLQDINSRDGQYAERELPPLQHASAIAQPFDNDYTLGSITVRRARGATTLTSITSLVSHDLTTTFDASSGAGPDTGPRVYREAERILLVNNETRLVRRTAGGGWLLGLELLHSDDRFSRTLGPPGTDQPLAGTRNEVSEGSLFGEYTRSLTTSLSATAGARLVFSRLVAQALNAPLADEEPNRSSSSVLPSVGLVWTLRDRLVVFARYQEGFRPGGLSVGDVAARFRSDTVSSQEIGFRYGTPRDVLSGSATVSRVRWESIQADLVAVTGLPFIANVGSGNVVGFEAQANWRLAPGLVIDGAVFLDGSGLTEPAPGFASNRGDSLPNVAAVNLRGGFRAEVPIAGRRLGLSGSIRYVGRSRLGVGPVLDLGQGGYTDTTMGVTMPVGRVDLSLDATNLLDQRGNIFALGNPFSVALGRQVTPLRPRTLRLSARFGF